MKITCISDLHGETPDLPDGDLLIVAGDLTASDKEEQLNYFEDWLCSQPYKKKIIIAGNHDNILSDVKPKSFRVRFKNKLSEDEKSFERFEYLFDSGTEFEGLKIWGTPWSLWFHGINPHCKAFTGSENDLKKRYDLIPSDIDILISHTPPHGILDSVKRKKDYLAGSVSLRNMILSQERFPNLKLIVCGHIHEWGGRMVNLNDLTIINASIMNEDYEAVNDPITLEL